MLNSFFSGLFDSSAQAVISVSDFLICIGVSLAIGVFLSAVYACKSKYTKSFIVTLALLPAVICVIIMMVNGNIGAGVAVAGAFSLVRFRSVPGTAKEIGTIFLAMGAGLAAGMGYLAYAALFSVIMGAAMLLFTCLSLKKANKPSREKTLRITIPENLDYTGVFDDIFDKYTERRESVSVKTTNMGSLYKLTYDIVLKDLTSEKKMIDELRCRNGNLEISICRQEANVNEL